MRIRAWDGSLPVMHVAEKTSPASAPRTRWRCSPRLRRSVLTVHIVASVGLLGDVAAVLAMNVVAATTSDPAMADAVYDLLDLFAFLFGIPLSSIALTTGIALGVGSKWGVVRTRWVAVKLGLLLSVVLVGATVLGPNTAVMREGDGGREAVLIAGAAYQLVALALATGLSVFKPRLSGRPRP